MDITHENYLWIWHEYYMHTNNRLVPLFTSFSKTHFTDIKDIKKESNFSQISKHYNVIQVSLLNISTFPLIGKLLPHTCHWHHFTCVLKPHSVGCVFLSDIFILRLLSPLPVFAALTYHLCIWKSFLASLRRGEATQGHSGLDRQALNSDGYFCLHGPRGLLLVSWDILLDHQRCSKVQRTPCLAFPGHASVTWSVNDLGGIMSAHPGCPRASTVCAGY